MRDLLPLFSKPSHYLGCEHGAVHKDPAAVSGRMALAFPDLYHVGMSYLGMAILYNAVNQRPQLYAERVFAPSRENAAVLQEHSRPLATLETATPLADLDAVGFHLTHEMCYTNVLWMLDLAHIPLRAAERDDSHPVIIAGGGAAFNPEPVAPFLDLVVLGDAEALLPDLLERIAAARRAGLPREEQLEQFACTPGVYVPSLFADAGPGAPPAPLRPGYQSVDKCVLPDLDLVPFPTSAPQPFEAVHDRMTLEIARGCTRGCRFCHAGMVYRPVRERSLKQLDGLLQQGLDKSGYEEVSFLSLSTGDYSGLRGLFSQSMDRCRAEQVAVSLPSLRVGSVDEHIMSLVAGLRRTGATIAPEAGSQRLRDVINKGITESELMAHVEKLFHQGWSSVKLYFMIGLPTETREDLDAILELAQKVEALGEKRRRLQVTAAISPFVPKPHTPFQWEPQISLKEIRERVEYLREIFRPYRRLKLRWHIPDMSFLEGVFSRGDRALAPLVEEAYRRGALFSSWADHLDIERWEAAMKTTGVDPACYTGSRDPEGLLPWDHLNCGVSKQFLLRERKRALAGQVTEDCRLGPCRNCGVCSHEGRKTTLSSTDPALEIRPRTALNHWDQTETYVVPASLTDTNNADDLHCKASRLRLWFSKKGRAAFISQLELQAVLERAFRRGRVPLAFSGGYHPAPLMSFGRALPVGVDSLAEYADVFLREELSAPEVHGRLAGQLPLGLQLTEVVPLPLTGKQPQNVAEEFTLEYLNDDAQQFTLAWRAFLDSETFPWTRQTKKGERTLDARAMVKEGKLESETFVRLTFDWSDTYVSPLNLVRAVFPEAGLEEIRLTKVRQIFGE